MAHGYHCAPNSTMIKETTKVTNFIVEPLTCGGVLSSITNPPPPFRGHHWGSAFTYKQAVSLLFAIVFSSSICTPEANLAHYKKYLGAVPPSRITCFLTFAARHLPHFFIHKMSSWCIDEAIAYNEDKLFAHG